MPFTDSFAVTLLVHVARHDWTRCSHYEGIDLSTSCFNLVVVEFGVVKMLSTVNGSRATSKSYHVNPSFHEKTTSTFSLYV